MSESWTETQKKLIKWQDNPSAWELRRILAHSDHFKIIAANAFMRAKAADKKKAIPSAVNWKDWWSFYLERLPEREAVKILLDVWNKDIWSHRQALARAQAHEILVDVAERARLLHEFSLALSALSDDSDASVDEEQSPIPGKESAQADPSSSDPSDDDAA